MTDDVLVSVRRLVDEVLRASQPGTARLEALAVLRNAFDGEVERAALEALYRARQAGTPAQECAEALGWTLRTAAARLRSYEDRRGYQPVTFRPNVGPLDRPPEGAERV